MKQYREQMGLLKVARVRSGAGDSDNFVDIAGYAACGFENYITIRALEENRMQKKIEILEENEKAYEDSIICYHTTRQRKVHYYRQGATKYYMRNIIYIITTVKKKGLTFLSDKTFY